MFGLKRMRQQRERLYFRTQILEKRAKASRDKAVDNLLDTATSPTGLLASFALGASTQLDITRKARKNLLNGASRDVASFLVAQVAAYMNNEPTKNEAEMPVDEDDKAPSKAAIPPENTNV